jgi:hypothetical protein
VLAFLPSPLDLFAIIFGILLTLRKLDVAHRQPSEHQNVGKADFERWQTTAMAAYGLGVWACFLKIVLSFAGLYGLGALQPPAAVRWTVGLGLDVAWIVALVVTWRRVSAAHRLAERVGVEQPRNAERAAQAESLDPDAQGSGSPPQP